MVPRQWKAIETVREKFSCRDCERISQARRRSYALSSGATVEHRLRSAMLRVEDYLLAGSVSKLLLPCLRLIRRRF